MPKITNDVPVRPGAKPPGRAPAVESGWNMTSGLKILIYGQSATGKTTLWGTFPGKILCLIASGRKRPGELKSIDTPENRKRIDARVVHTFDQLKRQLEDMHKFDCLVLDHVTGLQDAALKQVLGIDELPEQKSWGIATQQDWGQSTAMCKDVIAEMMAHPGDVAIIGQERSNKAGDGSPDDVQLPTVGVATTPSLACWLNPTADYIVQTYKSPIMISNEVTVGKQTKTIYKRGKGVHYCARIAPHDVFTTKFRLPRHMAVTLPDHIVDPTYDKIIELIRTGKIAPPGKAR